MAVNAQPGGENLYSINGSDASENISDFEVSEKAETVEFKGSGGSKTKQWVTGSMTSGSFTALDDPTLGAALRTAYRTVPKPTVVLGVQRYNTTGDTTEETWNVQISELKASGKVKDANALDVNWVEVQAPA